MIFEGKNFGECYAKANEIISHQESVGSRNGGVKEILNAQTVIEHPEQRVTLYKGRSTNVFFLLAEALWIFNGQRDVELLTIFNSKMKEYSDNGVTFHAPYGWRLRHWGVPSEIPFLRETDYEHMYYGTDQLLRVCRMIDDDKEETSRRIVASIWNPEYDLAIDSKDLPCNDMLMFKVRNGKLYQTIQNRSNDLHLGLFTNEFQFSILGELIALITEKELGTQTHNSQSLHVYDWFKEVDAVKKENYIPYDYENMINYPIDFDFEGEEDVNVRYDMVQKTLSKVLSSVFKYYRDTVDGNFSAKTRFTIAIEDVTPSSVWLGTIMQLLGIYIEYKFAKSGDKEKDINSALEKIDRIGLEDWDMVVGAKFFFSNLLSKSGSN